MSNKILKPFKIYIFCIIDVLIYWPYATNNLDLYTVWCNKTTTGPLNVGDERLCYIKLSIQKTVTCYFIYNQWIQENYFNLLKWSTMAFWWVDRVPYLGIFQIKGRFKKYIYLILNVLSPTSILAEKVLKYVHAPKLEIILIIPYSIDKTLCYSIILLNPFLKVLNVI